MFSAAGYFKFISILPIRLGSDIMCFVTSIWALLSSTSKSVAFMAIVVTMQVARLTQSKSVGLKRSPLPLLSVGASVSIMVPLCMCVAVQRNVPLYIILLVMVGFLNILGFGYTKRKFILHKFTQIKLLFEMNHKLFSK
jgi:hypothetical protein